jgi:hypothetical protein
MTFKRCAAAAFDARGGDRLRCDSGRRYGSFALRKEARLARHPGWVAYVARAELLLPPLARARAGAAASAHGDALEADDR